MKRALLLFLVPLAWGQYNPPLSGGGGPIVGSSGIFSGPVTVGTTTLSPTSPPVGGGIVFNYLAGSGLTSMLSLFRVDQDTASPIGGTVANRAINFVSGALGAGTSHLGASCESNTEGALTSIGAGVAIIGCESSVSIGSTGGTIPDVRGHTSNVTVSGTSNISELSVSRDQVVLNPGGATINSVYGHVFEEQTVGSVLNFSSWHKGAALFSNAKPIYYNDSAGTPIRTQFLNTDNTYIVGTFDAPINNGHVRFFVGGAEAGRILPTTKRWLINTTTDNGVDQLQVNGSVATGALKPTSITVNAGTTITSILAGTLTWDPGSLADGAATATTVTLSNVTTSYTCTASHNAIGSSNPVFLTANPSDTGSVIVSLLNKTGAPFDLPSGTLRVICMLF